VELQTMVDQRDWVLSRDQIREVDRIAIEDYGIPGVVLMENAGRGVADTIERLGIEGPVAIFCGAGNNGGDGFVIARHLRIRGHDVQLFVCADRARIRGDALVHLNIAESMRLPIEWIATDIEFSYALGGADWIVDALLGTGSIGEPRPPINVAIDLINQARAKRLAVDIPSGLDCDSGQPSQTTIRADHTCTFFAQKPAMSIPSARPFLGEVHVLDIGAPLEIAARVTSNRTVEPAED
jgi:NAD(P)H-hydrate epimerase